MTSPKMASPTSSTQIPWSSGDGPHISRGHSNSEVVNCLWFDDGLNHRGVDNDISDDPGRIGPNPYSCVEGWRVAPELLPTLSDAELGHLKRFLTQTILSMWNEYYGIYPPHPKSYMAVLVEAVDAENRKRQLAPRRALHTLLTTVSLCIQRRGEDSTELPIADGLARGLARGLAATPMVLMPGIATALLATIPLQSTIKEEVQKRIDWETCDGDGGDAPDGGDGDGTPSDDDAV